jgi:FkbM family methyltransferase
MPPPTPPLNLSINEVHQIFRQSFGMNLKIMRSLYGLRSLELFPDTGSALRLISKKNDDIPLTLPADEVIGANTFLAKQWDLKKANFFVSLANSIDSDLCLVDVGANIGLFSRQFGSQCKRIKYAYLYEPHPENFDFLRRNLSEWDISPTLINAALSDTGGKLPFYEDPSNCGNYSLNVNAMTDNMSQIDVEVLVTEIEEKKWLSSGLPIFYKSDTQGFDEKIASCLTLDFWANVRCACFELWRIEKPEFNRDRFAKVLESFPNRVFESNSTVLVGTTDVLRYLDGRDRKFDDLLCWR